MLMLPIREGTKPLTGDRPPHLQYSQQSPAEVHEKLADWLFSKTLVGCREEPTLISVPTSRALWLDESIPAPASAFMPPPGSREFAHLHADGSMHLTLAPQDEKEILRSGWGEMHPWRDRGVNEMLIYAPRSLVEVPIVMSIVEASLAHASGHMQQMS